MATTYVVLTIAILVIIVIAKTATIVHDFDLYR